MLQAVPAELTVWITKFCNFGLMAALKYPSRGLKCVRSDLIFSLFSSQEFVLCAVICAPYSIGENDDSQLFLGYDYVYWQIVFS